MNLEGTSIGVIDYCVFAALLVISLGIGVFNSLRQNKSPEQFFMGNRDFGLTPVSMSLLTSFVSAISLLGFSGETYAYGMQISLFLVGTVFGIGASALFILPVLYPLKLTSVNTYLELRFNSPRLCKVITLITCLKALLFMGICLYAPTIALASVTSLSSTTYIYILGVAVTIYSSIGGIRAVIWTDVFQLSVMLVGLVVIVAVGVWDVGGAARVWDVALAGGRLDIFNTNPSIYERHSFYNTILFGFVLNASFYGINQINIQRVCSVPKIEDARRVLLITVIGMILIYMLIFISGLVTYVAFVGCDPWSQGLIEKKEQILPYYMMTRLKTIPGLPGLFVATITGGALSSLSSIMNAVVALIWEDWCKQIPFFARLTTRTAGILTKVLSLIIGIAIIGLANVASHATNLAQFSTSVLGAFMGSIFGVFLLGLFFPRTNIYGVWTGLIISSSLAAWISSGAYWYRIPAPPLPLSTDGCLSVTFSNSSDFAPETTHYNIYSENATIPPHLNKEQPDFPLMKLYGISYTLYSFIGSASCVLVALVVSFLTGNEDLANVSPKYVTPLLRKFFWGEEILDGLELEQTEKKLSLTKKSTPEKQRPV